MKAVVFLVFICSISSAFCQESFITWNDKKPLQWLDFAGPVKDSSTFDAESFAEVKFSYTFNSLNDFKFDVNATFNKNTSWYKKETQSLSLLKHEQLHFDIAELFAKKLKADFDNHVYTVNFKNEIAEIFDRKRVQYHLMQEKYDEETSHSLNAEKQRQWEFAIRDELRKMQLIEDTKSSEQLLATNDKID
jgi:hypothetical protein